MERDLPDSGWDISFAPHWKVSRVQITFDSSTFESVFSEQNEDWKRYSDELHLERSFFFGYPGWRTVGLFFQGRRNSLRLAERLSDFPGVESVGTLPAATGRWSTIIPLSNGAGRRYFYRFLWGDCPSGCAYEDVYYLAVYGDSVELLGAYKSQVDSARFPLWWDTANTAFQDWRDN